MSEQAWRVGELAAQTGLSIRTLHYYDEIKLLSPSRRTAAGHRLYVAEDVSRLQQIRSLRQLGFTLEQIADTLRRPDFDPRQVIRLHLERVKDQLARQQQLCTRLQAIDGRLAAQERITVDELFETIREIEMSELYQKYYTPEQLQYLEQRKAVLGDDCIRKGQEAWSQLISDVRSAMADGTTPHSEAGRDLARRWDALIEAFTGGDDGVRRSLGQMWQQEPSLQKEVGIDQDMWSFIAQARDA